MGKQYIDVEVIVTSTVVYRLPRPTKAEIVEYTGDPDSWDKDDPESSIQEFLEQQGIEDAIKGFRPVSVTVDDIEVQMVSPAGKGQQPLEARPMVKIKCNIRKDDGSLVEAWWVFDTWRRVGDDNFGEPYGSEQLSRMASAMTRAQAKRIVLSRQEQAPNRIVDVEYIPA